MARQLVQPVSQLDWGVAIFEGGGSAPLTDNSTSTRVLYEHNSGSVVVFPEFTQEPSDPVIAVAVWYQQSNGGLFGMQNGWCEAHLRYDGVREPASRSYVQDGRSGSARTILGPPVYRPGMEAWTASELNKITADVGSATGPIAPNKNNRWCIANALRIALYTADPVPVPTFNSAPTTVTTSSVNFSATLSSIQRAQPMRAVFQVARNTGFTDDVRTFVGSLHAPSSDGGNIVSVYTSELGKESWTDLGPGVWHLRVKGRDFLGNESAWSTRISFTVNNAPLPDAVLVDPSHGGTISSPYATRRVFFGSSPGGTPTAFAGGVKVGARWQFSQSPTFASGVVEWLNLDGIFHQGEVAYDPEPASIDPGLNGKQVSYRDPSQYLSQGTWYGRARAEDRYGQVGATWSPRVTFTVAHAPTATPVYPVGGRHFDPVGGLLEWDFVDPWGEDRQSAYRIEVRDASGNVIYSPGWVTTMLTQAAVEIPDHLLNTVVRWRVQLRDRDGVTGPWSADQTFTYVRRPAVILTYPQDASYVEAGQPVIEWDVAFHPGASQTSYRVLILDSDTRATVYDSGRITNTVARSHAVNGTYLENMTNHEVIVEVSDTNDLTGYHSVLFTTNFTLPPTVAATASPSTYDELGYVRILWDGPIDPLFEFWRVYRRLEGSSEWTLAVEVDAASAREAKDWSVASSGTYVYAVVQVASRHGALVEGSKDSMSAPIRIEATSYWMVVPEMDFGVRVVPSADSFSREREQSTMDIIGRGRKINYGDAISREGSLNIPIRGVNRGVSAAELFDQIELLTTGVTGVYLRDPFGNYFPVALGSYSFDRMAGVGSSPMGDIEVPYMEVFA